jgi:cell division protein FtsX
MQENTLHAVWINIRQGIRSLSRTRVLSPSWGQCIITALLMQSLIVGLLFSSSLASHIENESIVTLTLKNSVSDQRKREFFASMHELSFISNTAYQTREQAMAYAAQSNPSLLISETSGASFTDTMKVTITPLLARASFMSFLQDSMWANTLDPLTYVEEEYERREIISMVSALHMLSWTLLLVSLLTIVLFVRIVIARKDNISEEDILLTLGASSLSSYLPRTVQISLQYLLPLMFFGGVVLALVSFPDVLPRTLLQSENMALRILSLQPTLMNVLSLMLLLEMLLIPLLTYLSMRLSQWVRKIDFQMPSLAFPLLSHGTK